MALRVVFKASEGVDRAGGQDGGADALVSSTAVSGPAHRACQSVLRRMGTGAAKQHPDPGWLQTHHCHARRNPSRSVRLTGRPKPNQALEPGSRQHHSRAASPDQPLMLMELLRRGFAKQQQALRPREMGPAGTETHGGPGAHRQRHHRRWRWPRQPDRRRIVERWRYLAEGERGGATTRRAAEALPPAPRCLPRAARRGGVRPPQPPPHADQRFDQSPGAHPGQGPLRMLRCRQLLGKPRTNGPWRWTTSCPGTRAARTTSATCRPSASAAMPASTTAVCRRKRAHRLPRIAGQRWEARGGLCVLRAGGQRPGAAGERIGAMHRRCRSGDAWAQPGDPAAACDRWVGVAPAGMERGGGAAEAAAEAAERPGCVAQRLGWFLG